MRLLSISTIILHHQFWLNQWIWMCSLWGEECQTWYFFTSSAPAQNSMIRVGGQFPSQQSLAPPLNPCIKLEATPKTINPTGHGAGIGLKIHLRSLSPSCGATKGTLLLRKKKNPAAVCYRWIDGVAATSKFSVSSCICRNVYRLQYFCFTLHKGRASFESLWE